jgi:acyl carrier protein
MSNLLPEVQDVFRMVFDRPDLVITRESSALNVEDWDSLTHINLVAAIEGRFKVRFALGELEELKNVGDLLDLMETKLARR